MKVFTFAGLVLLPAACVAQTFQNLDFEMAQIVPDYSNGIDSVVFSNAFPHWQGTVTGSPATYAIYNVVILDGNYVGIYSTNQPNSMPAPPMFGKYSAYLQSEAPPFPFGAELAQTGLIPSTARSIWFATTPYSLVGNPNLQPSDLKPTFAINGQSISYSAMDIGTNYVLWAADVSSFAGTVAEIRFTVNVASGAAIGLDNIYFSPEVVPEPGTLGLTALALSLLSMGLVRARARGEERSKLRR